MYLNAKGQIKQRNNNLILDGKGKLTRGLPFIQQSNPTEIILNEDKSQIKLIDKLIMNEYYNFNYELVPTEYLFSKEISSFTEYSSTDIGIKLKENLKLSSTITLEGDIKYFSLNGKTLTLNLNSSLILKPKTDLIIFGGKIVIDIRRNSTSMTIFQKQNLF